MTAGKSLHYCYQHLDYTRISLARERKGLTKKKLAELIDKKPSAVTQFESGKSGLTFDTFERLVEALDVPAIYLTDLIQTPVLRMETCHFRANRSVTQSDRYRALRFSQDVVALYSILELQHGIVFPEMSFESHPGPRPNERQIEQYAIEVRGRIGLGLGPILNMAELLESIGIRIILLPTECAVLDAFATWVDGYPCIMIAGDSPASRMQFDYAHEFAHLLLDEENPSGDPLVERLANRFASSFLMPIPTFTPDCPSRYNRSQFLSVKKFWHVSMKAAIYRAKQLGILSESQYTNAFVSMARQGINKDEPGEFYPPLPTMLEQALEMISHEVTIDSLANEIGLNPAQLLEILVVQRVSPVLIRKLTSPPPNAKILRLVKS